MNYNKLIIKILIALLIILTGFFCLKWGTASYLSHQYGLGEPLLYQTHPFYGYRPRANQHLDSRRGQVVHTNNLGLRNLEDWNAEVDKKILIVGDSVVFGGSIVSNDQLFTFLLEKKMKSLFKVGNAGVNGWGVENIYGLIFEYQFQPASQYLTMVLEDDFYRGRSLIDSFPYWGKKPSSPIDEVFLYYASKFNRKKYLYWLQDVTEEERKKVLEKSVRQIQLMEQDLIAKGYRHLCLISPTRSQFMNNTTKDKEIHAIIQSAKGSFIYIIDELHQLNLDDSEKDGVFYDEWHLTAKGHRLWAHVLEKVIKRKWKLPRSPFND